MLKALGEDTRLRIVNLLHKRSMNVAELCQILDSTQSNISKHLARLRLTGIVTDKREGQFIYYYLNKQGDQFHEGLINCVMKGLSESEVFQGDLNRLEGLKKIEDKKPLKKGI